MNRLSDPLHNLADALSEDVVAASPEMLAAEAAQEPGASVGLARDFDRVFTRAERQARWRRAGERLRALMPSAALWSWRPAMAALAGIAVIVVAGDIYMNVQPMPPRMVPVSSEQTRSRELLSDEIMGARRKAYRDEQGARIGGSAPSPAPPASAPPDEPRRIRTVPIPVAPSIPAQQPAPQAVAPSAAAPPAAKRAEPAKPIRTVRIPGITEAPNPSPPAMAKTAPGTTEDQSLALVDRGISPGPRPQSRGHVASASPPAAAAIDQAENHNLSPTFAWPLRGRMIPSAPAAMADKRDTGIDIAVPVGTDVNAAADGVVAYVGDDLKDFGNLILVRHDGGFVTAYAHLDKILVKADDHVERGQVIAKSGDTGTVSAPMLHFEIRKGATTVDARQYLRAN